MAVIESFDNGSVARHAGLKEGDEVISFNGRAFSDILDYLYADSLEEIIFTVKRKNRIKRVGVVKNQDEPLGINFKGGLEVKPVRCKNRCAFCFIDQLPEGMRETLYVKDDDYRFSVISGNYVTLTNLSDEDFERILEYKLSPLYVSVHAWNPEVRLKLVANPATKLLNERIKKLAESGVSMHTQVVLCEGINDGAVLKETVEELYKLAPAVKSLAIVPVGLTGHREGLYPLKPLSDKCLNETIDAVEAFSAEKGDVWCRCSDEFYVKSGRPLPPYESYGEFEQIENGVGLVTQFLKNFDDSLSGVSEIDSPYSEIAFVTGESFYPYLENAVAKIRPLTRATLDVCKVKNEFFGGAITVSGLITGGDIVKQVKKGYDKYVVPKNMLKEFNDVFLDGYSVKDLEKALCGKIDVAKENGGDLLDIIAR